MEPYKQKSYSLDNFVNLSISDFARQDTNITDQFIAWKIEQYSTNFDRYMCWLYLSDEVMRKKNLWLGRGLAYSYQQINHIIDTAILKYKGIVEVEKYQTPDKITNVKAEENPEPIKKSILDLPNKATSNKNDDKGKKNKPQAKDEESIPKTLEEIFCNADLAEPCINILRELERPYINANNIYIGKNKGIFPLWIRFLKNYTPPVIIHYPDNVYKDLLNKKFTGLNLTEDASEFRKDYKRLKNNNIELEIKTLFSQISQKGK